MKKYIFLAIAALTLLPSCKEQKENNVIIAPKQAENKPAGTIVMQDLNSSNEVQWMGKTYRILVERKADKSLPQPEPEPGRKAYDNSISLRIVRPDGSTFFNKTFKKQDFTSYLDEKTIRSGVLLGVVLDRAEGDNLIFAVSVGSPDALSDEFIPMILTVNRMGNISIKRDNTMDTAATPGDEEDDGV